MTNGKDKSYYSPIKNSLQRYTEYAFCRKVTFLGELLGKANILDIPKR
jgi:hypothetical protein